MLGSLVQWLDSAGSVVFWTCLIGLVAVNGAAAVLFVARRNRETVNRWTGPVLAANLALIGAGVAVPAATYIARTAAVALAPAAQARVAGSVKLGAPE